MEPSSRRGRRCIVSGGSFFKGLEVNAEEKTNGGFASVRVVPAYPRSPLSSEYGTNKTVEARLWPWLSGRCPEPL